MANKATFTFALPEDNESNYFQLHSSSTETGSYTQVGSDIPYVYGETTYEYPDLSVTIWYKIRFYNSVTGQYGPLSEAIYGGTWKTNTSPFLSISTNTDGANYASIQDVREFSGLNSDTVADARISSALRRSRALVDIRTDDMGVDRFANFSSDSQRKKYNASLRLIKEAEINYCLGMVYRGMVDDLIIKGLNGNTAPSSVTIGDVNISPQNDSNDESSYKQLERLSLLYTKRATTLLAIIQPTTINISYRDPKDGLIPSYCWPNYRGGRY